MQETIDAEVKSKILALSHVKHKLTHWESHPYGLDGRRDFGGFIECCEFSLKKGRSFTEKQVAQIDKMYAEYVLGQGREGEPPKPPPAGNESSFTIGDIGGKRCPEGWRIMINNVIVGTPTTRELAYCVAQWLNNSLASIVAMFAKQPQTQTGTEETQTEETESQDF